MIFDYSKLKGKIVEIYKSQLAFSLEMGMSQSTLNVKLNNKSEWTASEIVEACRLLEIDLDEAYQFFFTEKL